MPSSNKKDKIKELLKKHHEILSQSHISKLFSEDINRAKKFTTQFSDLYVDYSKNFITNETLDLLLQYAASSNLETTINAMFKGEKINHTEDRAALHVALRGKSKLKLENIEIENDIKNELKKIKSFANPDGIDLSSGVEETPGKKNIQMIDDLLKKYHE